MSLRNVILKHKIAVDSLEDDSLVQLFRELNQNYLTNKPLLREILKVLSVRKKLFMLTSH